MFAAALAIIYTFGTCRFLVHGLNWFFGFINEETNSLCLLKISFSALAIMFVCYMSTVGYILYFHRQRELIGKTFNNFTNFEGGFTTFDSF